MSKKKQDRLRVGERVTIFRTGKRGIYTAEFHFEGHRTRSLRTRNKEAAIKKAKLIDAQLLNGDFKLTKQGPKPKEKKKTMMRDAKELYIFWLKSEGRRKKTCSGYDGIIEDFMQFAESVGVTRMDSINLNLYDSYRVKCRERGLDVRTIFNLCRLLKSWLAWCAARELIGSNPLAKANNQKPRPRQRQAPTLGSVNAVLDTATNQLETQLAMLALTGLRAGELRHLRAEDVDVEGGWIHVRSRAGFETKTGEERKVPIHQRLREYLKEFDCPKRGWFFVAPPSNRYMDGNHHINTRRLNEAFKSLLGAEGLPTGRADGFTLHSLRRFFRTTTVNSGVPERVVDLWLGHRDTKDMGTIYYALDDETSQRFMLQVNFDPKVR